MNSSRVEEMVDTIIASYNSLHVSSNGIFYGFPTYVLFLFLGNAFQSGRIYFMISEFKRASNYRHEYEGSELFVLHWEEDSKKAILASLMMELQMALRIIADYPELNEVIIAKYLNDQFRFYLAALAGMCFYFIITFT